MIRCVDQISWLVCTLCRDHLVGGLIIGLLRYGEGAKGQLRGVACEYHPAQEPFTGIHREPGEHRLTRERQSIVLHRR